MSMQYIRDTYNVPAKRGMTVCVGGRMLKYSELKPYEQCAVRIGMAIIGVKDIKTAILEEIKADRLCARCWKRADKCECGNGY